MLIFALEPNDKFNHYRDIIKQMQTEKLLNHIIPSIILLSLDLDLELKHAYNYQRQFVIRYSEYTFVS